MSEKTRCFGDTPLYAEYHDNEWGRPEHDDRKLFEMLILEGAQAGLSWLTVLKKRDAYRVAFDGFDPEKVALYGDAKIRELLANEGIIRNRLKINAAITNAKLFLEVVKKYGSFDKFIWGYVDYKPIVGRFENIQDLPASTPLSDKISKDLKKLGFKFVGSTIIYSFMQAVGMANDHFKGCFVQEELDSAGI
jgi:DNA-3-methyladenine glycosylase I